MSREHGPVGLAIEWSPRGVVAYDAQIRQTRTANELSELGIKGREAVLALSRRGVFVRTARVPNASPAEIRTILTIQVGELFPLPIIDLAWNFALTNDINDDGRLAVLAAVPSADLRRAFEAASSAGLKVKAAVPLAIGATLIAQELGITDGAIVERADDGPAVDIVSGGSLRVSRATPASVPLEMEVSRALGLAGLDHAPIIAAGGADIPDAERSTDRTALMALADSPFDKLDLRLELPEAVAARAASSSRSSMRTALMTLAAAVVCALYVGMGWLDRGQEVKEAQTRANGVLTRAKTAQKKVNSAHDDAMAKKAMLDLAFKPAQPISDIVAVATANVPTGAWLKSLQLERGKALTIRGTAKSNAIVGALEQQLDAGAPKRFRSVDLTNANNALVEKTPVTEFVVSAFPIGNLPFLAHSGASK